jgi:hypothetical protein
MTKISNCPICGANAYLMKDIVDGYYFGWSIGCTRYRLNDKLHNVKMTFNNISSEDKAVKIWESWAKQHERNNK